MELLEKDDEWYTQVKDIEDEVNNHKSSFNGKIVYCNCDDTNSKFYIYFRDNFSSLGLRGLFCTSLRGTMTTFDGTEEKTKKIKDGSFQNNEHLIQKCDIVVSNPPFSLFTEYMKMLLNSGKGFLILGPVRSGYALMQYFDGNQIHFGTSRGMNFDTPSGEIKTLRNCGWFTNLDSDIEIKRHIRKLKDTDYFENSQDIIEIPAMYMPNLDKNGILHTNNGDYKKLPGGRRVNKNQRIKLQRITEKKTFVITERQEKILFKEFIQFGFSLGKLDAIQDYNERIKYCREFLGDEIGNGTSRIVFDLDDERVLKLAKDRRNIYQNKKEVIAQNTIGRKFPELFPKVFLNADNYSWIVSERVLTFKEEDCITILGIPYSYSLSYERAYNNAKENYSEYMKPNQLQIKLDFNEESEVEISLIAFIDWCERISNNRSTTEKEDKEYFKLVKEIPELEPFFEYIMSINGVTDLYRENFGLAMRNGKPTIIVLDNGSETFKESLLKEYLDKDAAMPVYNYLKDGERYGAYGQYYKSKELVYPFLQYVMQEMSQEDFVKFITALRRHPKLKNRIKIDNNRRYINCYSKIGDDFESVPTKQFIETNKTALYRIFEYEYPFTDFFDKFFFYINANQKSLNFLRRNGRTFNSNVILQNPKVMKTDWMIHFCQCESDAKDIWKNGFKYGAKDTKDIAFTNGFETKDNKKGGKISYSYNVNDILNGNFKSHSIENKSVFDNMFDQKAWERALHDCVMFKNSGVESYHSTDRENQVMFNNENIKDAVLLKFHWNTKKTPNEKNDRVKNKNIGGEMYWAAMSKSGKPLYKNNSLTEVIRWVKDNFDQYRKQLCWK